MSIVAVLDSVLTLGGVGLVFAVLIALAHRRFQVWEDPRIDAVLGFLPGANCGACGEAGCRAFAEALTAERVQPARCTVMSAADMADVAESLGIEAGQVNRRVARLLCAGDCETALEHAHYQGFPTCAAAVRVAGGGKACTWSCLGLGDCAEACSFGAIFMDRSGLPRVMPERCTSCGDCVEVCPRDLFTIMPIEQKLIVQCRNPLVADEAEALCRVACNGCGLCALDAAPDLIEIIDGLAVIDYSKNAQAGPDATRRCPTGAIAWVEGAQLPNLSENTPLPCNTGQTGSALQ